MYLYSHMFKPEWWQTFSTPRHTSSHMINHWLNFITTDAFFALLTLSEVNNHRLMFHPWLHVLLAGVVEGGVQLFLQLLIGCNVWSVLVHATCFQLKSQNCGQTHDLSIFISTKTCGVYSNAAVLWWFSGFFFFFVFWTDESDKCDLGFVFLVLWLISFSLFLTTCYYRHCERLPQHSALKLRQLQRWGCSLTNTPCSQPLARGHFEPLEARLELLECYMSASQ